MLNAESKEKFEMEESEKASCRKALRLNYFSVIGDFLNGFYGSFKSGVRWFGDIMWNGLMNYTAIIPYYNENLRETTDMTLYI